MIQNLQPRHGYKCIAVALPSTQSPDLPPAGLDDDTSAIRSAALDELDSKNNDVVVVAHSYGGCPANNALEGLSKISRKEDGYSTSVLSIVFLSAIPIPASSTFLSALGGKPHPLHDLSRHPEFAYVNHPGPEYYFYNTMSPSEAKFWADKLRPQAWRAYTEPTTYAAYKDIPVWYLKCKKDQALLYEVQEAIVKGMEEDGARKVVVESVGG